MAKQTEKAAIEKQTADKPPAKDPSFLEAQRRAQGETRISELHLKGEGHSWRGVRIKDLGTKLRRQCENQAAELAGADASPMKLRNQHLEQVLLRMIVAVTTEPVEDPRAEGVKWMNTPLAMLGQDGQWDKLFTARDTVALERIYNERHEVSLKEVEIISGKLLPVSSED
jgi:hypothetical protein